MENFKKSTLYAGIKTHGTTRSLTENLLLTTKLSAHVKDAKTGRYIDTNSVNLKNFGFCSPDDFTGLTLSDPDSFMNDRWGPGWHRKCMNTKGRSP